ncbi:helix-turn-helix domain-containing protein [Streptomyces vinaceus]|uniref:helix-turn-helix domain-containing protein n=1 Tax=Streptomyces vinaceus TaxID=1960 RepID=UPI003816B4B5
MLHIDDGSVITAAATAAGIDACLHLVRKDHGPAGAVQVARRMVVAAHREGGQAQFAEHSVVAEAPADDPIGSAMSHARDNLHRRLAVGELAGVAHLSVRQFERRFVNTTGLPPGRWLTEQRIRAGTVLLASADHPVDVVAGRVGLTAPVQAARSRLPPCGPYAATMTCLPTRLAADHKTLGRRVHGPSAMAGGMSQQAAAFCAVADRVFAAGRAQGSESVGVGRSKARNRVPRTEFADRE